MSSPTASPQANHFGDVVYELSSCTPVDRDGVRLGDTTQLVGTEFVEQLERGPVVEEAGDSEHRVALGKGARGKPQTEDAGKIVSVAELPDRLRAT